MQFLRSYPEISLLIAVFLFSYLIFFPQFFFSIDELSYFSRALAFGHGMVDWTQVTTQGKVFSWCPANYPIGTAAVLSLFGIFGKQSMFLSGLIYSLISVAFISATLKKIKQLHYSAFVFFFVFPPTIFFSRGLMSEMPSLVLISFYTYLFFSKPNTNVKLFCLGGLAGLSILFRETNIVVCGGLVMLICLKNYKFFISFSLGTLLGLVPRVLSSDFFYGSVAYVKEYPDFGIQYFSQNFLLYLVIITIVIPGGAFLLWRYKGREANSVKLSLSLFILLHLAYGYHSGIYSGKFVSIFYNGRYFIPTIPLWCIIFAEFFYKNDFFNQKKVKSIIILFSSAFVFSFHGLLTYVGNEHKEIAEDIFRNYNNETIVYSNDAYRYLNPLHGDIVSLCLFDEVSLLKEQAYLVLSGRNNTDLQSTYWDGKMKKINKLDFSSKEIKRYSTFDGTKVVVFQMLID